MAIIDSVLVDIIAPPIINGSVQAYINRDKVLYYRQYVDEKGQIYADLTMVFFPDAAGARRIDAPIVVKMSIADFNTLMTT